MKIITTVLLSMIIIFLTACATTPPKNSGNVCDIFKEKKKWYNNAKDSENKWQTPVPVSMAMIYQESSFQAKVKPPRNKFLWIFPGARPSSAYGYAQVIDGTWEWYQNDTRNQRAKRHHFADAVDFVGWYNNKSHHENGIAYNDAYNLYLAYHEGHGGYSRATYQQKAWLKQSAQQVSHRANTYQIQLASCEQDLQKHKRFWFF